MKQISDNNRRIIRNTILLYFRMFLILLISLFTSRILLQALGIEDYGIYNVVGGIIAMSGVLNSAMSSSVTRYLTFEIGKGDFVQLRKVFSVSLSIYFLLCLAFLIIAETIGLWFLNNKLLIPIERLTAANYVYQYAIISTIFTLIANPYNAAIISHEKMSIYAYVSIIEVVLKLIIVYIILIIPLDRLSTYGGLVLFTNIVVTFLYVIYCRKKFPECKYKIYRDKKLFNQLFAYSGWNLFGAFAGLVKGQGLNILLNMFFNPSINAARGIAYQINTAVTQFSSNFYTAVRPQITKYYAQNDIKNMFQLVFRSSRMSYYLILLLSLPILIETQYILDLWLEQVPDSTIIFVRFIIVISAIEVIANPLMTTAHATGKIALYQSLVGSIIILNIPISYLLLKNGNPAVTVFIVSLIITIICLFVRLWIVKKLVNFPFFKYTKEVLGKCLLVSIISTIVSIMVKLIFPLFPLMVCLLVFLLTIIIIFYIGLNFDERSYIKQNIIKNKYKF